MPILNLTFSGTGNIQKVADTIEKTVKNQGRTVSTVRIRKDMETRTDLFENDLFFAGSGGYEPGLPANP